MSGRRSREKRHEPLTGKHARFIAEYLVDLNATQAAIRAGYSRMRPDAIGYENLTKPDIVKAIAAKQQMQLRKIDVTAGRALTPEKRSVACPVCSRCFGSNV